jgi:hypothetical protein
MRATVKTRTVARWSRTSLTTLNLWVADGTIKPAVRGSKGNGNSHRFRYGQALGIVLAQALRETIGCNVEQLRAFAAMSDADFLAQYADWKAAILERDFNGNGDGRAEEEDAEARHRLALFNVGCRKFARLAAKWTHALFAHYHARQPAEVALRVKASGRPLPTAKASK